MAFYDTWDTEFPLSDYRFDDPNGTAAFNNTGTGSQLVDSGGVTFQQAGPITDFAGTDYAVAFDGISGSGGSGDPIPFTSATQGTIIISFKADSTGTGSQRLFYQDDPTNSRIIDIVILSSGYFYCSFERNGSSDRIVKQYQVDMRDDTWHMMAIRQKADASTGMEFHLDTRSNLTMATSGTNLTLDATDYWFNDVFAGTEVGSGIVNVASKRSSSGFFKGELALLGVNDTAISDANLDILFAGGEWFTNPFAAKTIRRHGRRLYSANV